LTIAPEQPAGTWPRAGSARDRCSSPSWVWYESTTSRNSGLVGDEQLRWGNRGPLRQAAGELVRIAPGHGGGIGRHSEPDVSLGLSSFFTVKWMMQEVRACGRLSSGGVAAGQLPIVGCECGLTERRPMPNWAEQVTAIATAVGAIGLIGAVFFAARQACEARIGRPAATAVEFFRRWDEGPLVETRRLVA
jgi:hypothetical protein